MQIGRLPWLRRDELDLDQQALYDAIVDGPRGSAPRTSPLVDDEGRLYGPFPAQLLDPPLGDALQQLGAAVRYRSRLSERMRELAILEVAFASGATYEWEAHVGLARRTGVGDEDLEMIRKRGISPSLTEEERLATHVVRALIEDGDLSDELYREAEDRLGAAELFDLLVLIGHYQLLARLLRVFRVPLPPGSNAAFQG